MFTTFSHSVSCALRLSSLCPVKVTGHRIRATRTPNLGAGNSRDHFMPNPNSVRIRNKTNAEQLRDWLREYPTFKVKCIPTAATTPVVHQLGEMKDVRLLLSARTILIRFYPYTL